MESLQNKVGIGVIVRDHEGQVIATQQASRNLKASTLMTETYAAMMATTFNKELGVKKIMMEGDAIQVVRDLQKETNNRSNIGALTDNVKNMMLWFTSWSIQHFPCK